MADFTQEGIPLWKFRDSFAPRENLWLRDQYSGLIVAREQSRLQKFQDVTVTGCYPALDMAKDRSSVCAVLVCWGNHDEILKAMNDKK